MLAELLKDWSFLFDLDVPWAKSPGSVEDPWGVMRCLASDAQRRAELPGISVVIELEPSSRILTVKVSSQEEVRIGSNPVLSSSLSRF